MKKYISPRIEEIKMKADIIATSFGNTNNKEGYSEDGYEGGYAPTRRNRYDAEYDIY